MNWLKEIAEADSIEALLGVVNDYLLQQADEFWSWIPKDSRPKLTASEDEVHYWHRKLIEDLAQVANPNIRMQDLCVFFVRAAARALELRAPGKQGPSSNDREFSCSANRASTKRFLR